MVKIFVSYSHDDKAVAKAMEGYLSKVYDDVWFDEKLHTGDAWWERIVGKIENCSHFIFLMSNESLKSAFCRKELAFAQEKGKTILPIKVRRSIDLPNDLKYLEALQICEMLGEVTISSLNELYAAIIRKSGNWETQSTLTEAHRQADLRQIGKFWACLPEEFIKRQLGFEIEKGRIKTSDFQALFAYERFMGSTHYRFNNTNVQTNFERFHEFLEDFISDIQESFGGLDHSGEYLINFVWHWNQDPSAYDIEESEVNDGIASTKYFLDVLTQSYKDVILCIKHEYPEFDFPME